MMPLLRRLFASCLIFGAAFAGSNGRLSGQSAGQMVEWRTYGGDLASTRYSPLAQITPANFNKQKPAGPLPVYDHTASKSRFWRRISS